MTDKEFKRLSRAQLIDIIYQLQLQMDELSEQKQALEKELADKRLRLSNIGNIAEAALEINDCFRSAQNAAEQYLAEIKMLREEAETERQRILAQARAQAQTVFADATHTQSDHDSAVDRILEEFERGRSDDGWRVRSTERKRKFLFLRRFRLKRNGSVIADKKRITRRCAGRCTF